MFLLIHEDFTVTKTLKLTEEDEINAENGCTQIIDITGCSHPKEFLNSKWIDIEINNPDPMLSADFF